ncbi:MAG: hypothetical protein RXR43_13820, partial [Sulfolobus sp.]
MTDVVKIIKQLINANPSLKQKLLEQGIIAEKGDDIVILKPEAFEIVGSNSAVTDSVKQTEKSDVPDAKIKIQNEKNTKLADMAGEKHEWLKQTEKSDVPDAKIKIQNEKNTNPDASSKITNPDAHAKNTSNTRESASEIINPDASSKNTNPDASRKIEFSKAASGTSEKSVEKTH